MNRIVDEAEWMAAYACQLTQEKADTDDLPQR